MPQIPELTDEQIEAIALDTLAFFGDPTYENALGKDQVIAFARALLAAAAAQSGQAGQAGSSRRVQ